MNSTSLSEDEIIIFKNMIGKSFDMFKCDPFSYNPMVYGIVGLYIDKKSYRLTSLFRSVNRFFSTDDVASLSIEACNDCDITTFMDNGELIEMPVESKIVSIDIITDHQRVTHLGDERSLDYAVGIIFHLEDMREISFEIATWFSEMITIQKGESLIDKFASVGEFLEEWEGCAGYEASCSREITTLD